MIYPLDLSGKRILVTGASAGIGQGIAILLSKLNARVVCVGRDADALAETRSQMEGEGHSFLQFDLTAVEDIPQWMKTLGPLQGLVHSAGINLSRPLKILTHQDYMAIMTINLEAAIALCKGFRQKPVCPNGGSVVFLSSVAALKGQPSIAAYAASKGALLSLGRTLALELARDRIRVNCLCPALIKTRMADKYEAVLTPEAYEKVKAGYPLGLVGTPEDVANATAFFLSDASRWITGATLRIDGGSSA